MTEDDKQAIREIIGEEILAFRGEMTTQFAQLRTEMDTQLTELRTEMNNNFKEVTDRQEVHLVMLETIAHRLVALEAWRRRTGT